MLDNFKKERMFDIAREKLHNAYSLYSKIKVSAVVLDDKDRFFAGVNVENASFGLTVCAERNAIANAVVEGAKCIEAILIMSSIGAIPPCGACRQVISEFSKSETRIILANESEIVAEYRINELLPFGFEKKFVSEK